MKKYILYARVSTETQNSEGTNLSQQIESLMNYAKLHDMEVGEVISEVASGVEEKRTGLNKALNTLFEKNYQGILCSSLDRLSRSFLSTSRIISLIIEKNREIITLNKTYLDKSPDTLEIELSNSLAKYYQNKMRERIREGIKQAQLQRKDVFGKKGVNF